MTTVVLGWDGLDYELLSRFNLHNAFGEETAGIETITNQSLDKPHTWELWPSIITGERPEVHGIHADEYIENNWSNPLISFAAQASRPIPDAIRWRVGRWVRGAGAEIAFETAGYYHDREIPTLFEGRSSFPLAIPNYRSEVDERFGMSSDRGAELAEYMSVETDENGDTYRETNVTPETFSGRIASDCAEKIGLVQQALYEEYDIVFAWLGYLDTAGHIAPTVADSDRFLERAYQTASDYTKLVQQQLDDDDTLVCLSDHGLQNGKHTETACIGSWPAEIAEEVDTVLDVYDALDSCTGRSRTTTSQFTDDDSEAEIVRERLENLGYVN